MSSIIRKTELSPVEALIVERALGDEARRNAQSGTLARIQLLTAERAQLYANSAAHPLLGPANGPRIRALSAEIDRLWILLRRERANRRNELERALHVEPEEDESSSDSGPIRTAGSPDAA
jgi:hypothetical protein